MQPVQQCTVKGIGPNSVAIHSYGALRTAQAGISLGVHRSASSGHLMVKTTQYPRLQPLRAAAPEAPIREKWWHKEAPSNVKHVHGVPSLLEELSLAGDGLLIIDYFAPWCAACRALYPKLLKIAGVHKDVKFLCINVEDNQDIARALGIKMLPFFQLYRGPEGKVDEFPASITRSAKIVEAIERHNTPRCFLDGTGPGVLEELAEMLPNPAE